MLAVSNGRAVGSPVVRIKQSGWTGQVVLTSPNVIDQVDLW
jgi:hypothetical protein